MEQEGTTVAVNALAFASTFRLRDLVPAFPGAETTLAQDELHVRFSGDGTAICFDFGAVVFFGVDAARRAEVVKALTARVGEAQPPHTDDFLVEVRPEARPEVRFDRVVVPELSPPVEQVVGLLLAQSAAMDHYDQDVLDILGRTDKMMRELGERGQLRGRVRNLRRFIGTCLQTKNEVIETLALFDKPEATWEDEALDRLYVRLRRMLEIDDRFRALEYRLRVIQENLVLLVDLASQRSNFVLEAMIVGLIVFEIILTLVRRGGA